MAEDAPAKPTVRMSEDELWAFVEAGHTGILTTLRADGRPISLPVWYATVDRRLYISTRGRKLERIQRDPRCSFLVEDGERWAELRAVHLECEGHVIEADEELAQRIAEQMEAKYAAFQTRRSAMPTATREHYARGGGLVELVPVGKVLNWDNSKLGL
jgi:nitroimidazol reductase NimA-like FMN-containing flavoprotein (pyridoxamine 5'-phosphate oxidase superfamily)